MPAVKTAISMDESLFASAEKVAAEMEIPRSQLFSLAMEKYLEQRLNESIIRAINEAYADEETDPEEIEYNRARSAFVKRQMWKSTENDEW
jgi:metal-responsive CopG/Arc/MetJ family transcriptional regulator